MLRKGILLSAAAGLMATAPAAAAPDYAGAIKADYDKSLGALWDHFHRNPELSFREFNTAARMAKELRAVPGMVVTEKVGQTGVVGVLKNGDGPVVLVRADMDGRARGDDLQDAKWLVGRFDLNGSGWRLPD